MADFSVADGAAPVNLASQADLSRGAVTIRPSLRRIEGPLASREVEPRVMQVLIALARAGNGVTSRAELMRTCWHGMVVGDDAVNRAIFELRRAVRDVGGGLAVETIPRVGYRLTGGEAAREDTPPPVLPAPAPSRRGALAAAGAGLAALGLGGAWWWAGRAPRATSAQASAAIEKGSRAMRLGGFDPDSQGVAEFRRATELDPDSAEAWGYLALAQSRVVQFGRADQRTAATEAAQQAARRALALDPGQPNATLALGSLTVARTDWAGAEALFRSVLRADPANLAALDGLEGLMQAVGRTAESWRVNRRAAALEPLNPTVHFHGALKMWIMGRLGEADRLIDHARQLWPRDPWVWNARLVIYAFSGRPAAARAFLDDAASRPPSLPPPAVAVLGAMLAAIETRAPADIAIARARMLTAARANAGLAAFGIMGMGELGEIDAAYAIIDGLLLRDGALVGTVRDAPANSVAQSPLWQQTQWLFTPPTTGVRADPRFDGLCRRIGLLDYWRKGGIRPDHLP